VGCLSRAGGVPAGGFEEPLILVRLGLIGLPLIFGTVLFGANEENKYFRNN